MSTPVDAMSRAVSGVMPPEASVKARLSTMATARRRGRDVHVIEQNGIDAERQRLVELVQGIDLQLLS